MTNLDVFRLQAKAIGAEAVRAAALGRGTRLHIVVLPKESSWYLDAAITEGVKQEGLTVSRDSVAQATAEFGIANGRVVYENIRRDGFFGAKIVDRRIDLVVSVKVAHHDAGSWAGDLRRSDRDTITVDDIERVETATIPMTRGRLPSEGFFSNVAEPLILIGSIAVAVLLLFNVRS